LDVVRWLRVGRDIAEPQVTGLLSVHDDEAALEAYRTHPDHQPSITRTRELGITASRFDIETPDDAADLP
jgi:quinol monooxygenase YgiN